MMGGRLGGTEPQPFHFDSYSLIKCHFGLVLLPTPLSWALLMECAVDDAVVSIISVSLWVGKAAVEGALLLYLSASMCVYVVSLSLATQSK
jgi:hypothetical protein